MDHLTAVGFRRLVVGLIASLTLCVSAYAQNPDGTYRLVMRKLPDGTVLTPPAVHGVGTFKNGVYQLTLFWRTPEGKTAALSRISEWKWSETEVAAKPLVLMLTMAAATRRSTSGEEKSSACL